MDRHVEAITEIIKDTDLVYTSFFADFGPLDLGLTCSFCQRLQKLQTSKKKVIYYCSSHPHFRANSAVLLCAYMIFVLNYPVERAYAPFIGINPPFTTFRDAGFCINTFPITVLDCARAMYKAVFRGHFDYRRFSIDTFQRLAKLQNGDVSWIVPGKFIAFSGPVAKRRQISPGVFALMPAEYVPLMKGLGVTCIIRFNSKCYDRAVFTAAGIRHVDLYYEDGGNPTEAILQAFLQICENERGAIAVHCKAGLGRTGTNIAAYMVKHYGYSVKETIAWCRMCRPGSIVGPQQQYLMSIEDKLRREGDAYRLKHGLQPLEDPGAAAAADADAAADQEVSEMTDALSRRRKGSGSGSGSGALAQAGGAGVVARAGAGAGADSVSPGDGQRAVGSATPPLIGGRVAAGGAAPQQNAKPEALFRAVGKSTAAGGEYLDASAERRERDGNTGEPIRPSTSGGRYSSGARGSNNGAAAAAGDGRTRIGASLDSSTFRAAKARSSGSANDEIDRFDGSGVSGSGGARAATGQGAAQGGTAQGALFTARPGTSGAAFSSRPRGGSFHGETASAGAGAGAGHNGEIPVAAGSGSGSAPGSASSRAVHESHGIGRKLAFNEHSVNSGWSNGTARGANGASGTGGASEERVFGALPPSRREKEGGGGGGGGRYADTAGGLSGEVSALTLGSGGNRGPRRPSKERLGTAGGGGDPHPRSSAGGVSAGGTPHNGHDLTVLRSNMTGGLARDGGGGCGGTGGKAAGLGLARPVYSTATSSSLSKGSGAGAGTAAASGSSTGNARYVFSSRR